jgi:hypothetical protein
MTFSNTRIAATGSGMEVRLLLLVLDGEEDEILLAEVGGGVLSAAGKGGNGGKGTDDCGELLDEDLDR